MQVPGRVLVFLACFLSYLTTSNACKGCVELDELNFEKIITKFPVVLVKFDVAYPYGDKHEIYSQFSQETASVKDILFAAVGVKDYGEKDNEGLATQYGVTKDDYPSLRLFKQDLKKPVVFPKKTEFTLDNLRNFVKDNTDIYIGLPGCLEKFDRIAADFAASTKKEKVLEDAKKLYEQVNEKEQSSAKIYLAIMKKVIETGKEFITNEAERVSKLAQGKVSEKKKAELQYKLNIIRAFSMPRKDEL